MTRVVEYAFPCTLERKNENYYRKRKGTNPCNDLMTARDFGTLVKPQIQGEFTKYLRCLQPWNLAR